MPTESNVRQVAADTLTQLTALVKSVPLAGMSEIDVDLTLSIGGVSVPLKGTWARPSSPNLQPAALNATRRTSPKWLMDGSLQPLPIPR